VKRGYKVTVVTGKPNYPTGKFYKGYGFLKKRKENYNGIDIIRLPITPRGKNYFTLSINYISYIVSGFFWNLFTKIKADYIFAFGTSPITQALPGIWYAKKHKVPCYIYLQDLWPESVQYMTEVKNKLLLKILGRISDYVYKNCNYIFVPSKGFIHFLTNRRIEEEKIVYWPQYAEEFYVPLKKNTSEGSKESFNIIFTGNIGIAQGLEILPKTAEIIKNDYPNSKIKFNIVGDGRYKHNLIEEIKRLGLEDMFKFTPYQPSEKIPELIAQNDAGFLSLKDNPIFRVTIPAKLQSYLACGVPIVAAINGEAANIITESKTGLCSPPDDAKALAENIVKLSKSNRDQLSEFSKNARNYYEYNFEKKKLFDQLEKFFQDKQNIGGN